MRAPDLGWAPRFLGICLALAESRFDGESTLSPQAGNAGRWLANFSWKMFGAQQGAVMNDKSSFMKVRLISMFLLLVACNGQLAPAPISTKLATATSVPPTETPTLMPSQTPTNTPTITPTPLGGRKALLLFDNSWQQDPVTKQLVVRNQNLYVYDVNSHKINLFLEGFTPVGVSPDGKEVALLKTTNERTDLLVKNLADPEQPVLLREDVEDAVWSRGTDWIGFIALTNGIRQVFIIQPDGSDLTQVTNSDKGAVQLLAAFHDRVFWGEGTVGSDGVRMTYDYKSTTLDGVETVYPNFFESVAPSGNFVLIRSAKKDPNNLAQLIDVVTSEEKDIVMPVSGGVRTHLLTDDKLLLNHEEDYLISSDGAVLLNFADLPHHHDPVPENAKKVDHYWPISQSQKQPVSPDGNLLLIEHFVVFSRNPLNYEASYYVLNLLTGELQELPGLFFTSKDGKVANNGRFIDGVVDGFMVEQAFWVELP